jgi:hypothetical protein
LAKCVASGGRRPSTTLIAPNIRSFFAGLSEPGTDDLIEIIPHSHIISVASSSSAEVIELQIASDFGMNGLLAGNAKTSFDSR